MFSDILKILGFIKEAAKGFSKLKSESDRKKALLEMLKIYFYLYDAYFDGVKLLNLIGENPIDYVNSLDDCSLKVHLDVWDKVLRRQGVRLYEAQVYITSQSYLAVLNPIAVEKISEVIGCKMNRLVTLHGLGAGLFFRNIFPVQETPEDLAGLVLQMLTKQESGLVDVAQVSKELEDLKQALDEFRIMIDYTMKKEEIFNLSKIAREETFLSADA